MCVSFYPINGNVITHVAAHTVHLERKTSCEEAEVRFWMAELSSALAYLHKQRIIHR